MRETPSRPLRRAGPIEQSLGDQKGMIENLLQPPITAILGWFAPLVRQTNGGVSDSKMLSRRF